MGFFGSLFGGGNKTETVAEEKVVATPVAAPVATGVQPEVIAAITAGVYAVMADDAEMIAAIKHAGGGVPVVRIKRANNLWAISGRNDLMDARKACF